MEISPIILKSENSIEGQEPSFEDKMKYRRIFSNEENVSLLDFKNRDKSENVLGVEWLEFFLRYPQYIPEKFKTDPKGISLKHMTIIFTKDPRYHGGHHGLFYQIPAHTYYRALHINLETSMVKEERFRCGFDWYGYVPVILDVE